MIESGLVTRTVEIAENVRIEMDFETARSLLNVLYIIKNKGLDSLFNDDDYVIEEVIAALSDVLDTWVNCTDENNHIIEIEEDA